MTFVWGQNWGIGSRSTSPPWLNLWFCSFGDVQLASHKSLKSWNKVKKKKRKNYLGTIIFFFFFKLTCIWFSFDQILTFKLLEIFRNMKLILKTFAVVNVIEVLIMLEVKLWLNSLEEMSIVLSSPICSLNISFSSKQVLLWSCLSIVFHEPIVYHFWGGGELMKSQKRHLYIVELQVTIDFVNILNKNCLKEI